MIPQSDRRTPWLYLLLLSGLLFAARAPYLPLAYGLDRDTRRIMEAADHLDATGEYKGSRIPGYPLQDYLYASLPSRAPVPVNTVTSIFGFLATTLLGFLLFRLGSRDWALGMLGLGMTPVFFIHACDVMDYVWGTSLILGSVALATTGRARLAGLALGLATGTRITSLVAAAPVAWILLRVHRARPRALVEAALLVAAVAGLAFWPVFARYGWEVLSFADDVMPPMVRIKHGTFDVWGYLATPVWGCAVIVGTLNVLRWRAAGSLPRGVPGAHLVGWGVIVVAHVVMFLRLPHEAGYLLPAIPFIFLLAAWALPRRLFQTVCIATVLSALTWNVKAFDLTPPEIRSPASFEVRAAGQHYIVDPIRGPIVAEYLLRRRIEEFRRSRAAAAPPAK